jgi:nicotinamidase-related amidase
MDEYVRPHPDSAALLTIDVQCDFTLPDAPATIPGTRDALPEMERLVEAFRSQDRPIVHVVRLYRPDGSNVDLCRRGDVRDGDRVVTPGSDGAQLVTDLRPSPDARLDAERLLDGRFQQLGPGEYAMYKPRWSAFHETPLGEWLRQRDVDTVVVCGCNFPNCPRTTVYDASQRDFRLVFVPDATSRTYDRGLEELRDIGVAVRSTNETRDWLADQERSETARR